MSIPTMAIRLKLMYRLHHAMNPRDVLVFMSANITLPAHSSPPGIKNMEKLTLP